MVDREFLREKCKLLIDPEILYGILRNNLGDLRLFAGMVRDMFLKE
ncbi:hypothetical protein Desku_1711 [Desulfofundulus kuznetsovii DSM 6115]|uniref:Uncharacterized protein n=1 Tax=Desulfofundulus kuznetsovii (strain DSM 6115 / VKM B-1805 / 17) TaxID=760568 RepID=A0AAU8PI20_DESK7|nr:hypothetical protein Desku_1711 [Desulfofundulus kuznetsovii DSM 6115]